MTVRPLGGGLFRADMTKLIVVFRSMANAPKIPTTNTRVKVTSSN